MAILLALLSLGLPGCAGTEVHGLEPAAWFALLAGDSPLPIDPAGDVDTAGLMRLGDGALLFLGMAAEDRGDEALATRLWSESARNEASPYRERAASLLAARFEKSGDGNAMLGLARSDAGAALLPYRRAMLELRGLYASGTMDEVLDAAEAMRTAWPTETATDAVELAGITCVAGYRAGRGHWADELALLAGLPGSGALYTTLASAVETVIASGTEGATAALRATGPAVFLLAHARAAYGKREYGQAIVSFRRWGLGNETPEGLAIRMTQVPGSQTPGSQEPDAAATSLKPEIWARILRSLPPALASEAARSLIAGSAVEGRAVFEYLVRKVHDWSVYPDRKYFEIFWYARFLREDKEYLDAAAWFAEAAAIAATPADYDAAAWYRVECLDKAAGNAVAARVALREALAVTRNAGYYSDLIEPMSRQALTDRDGGALVALDMATAGRATEADRSRLAYLCARAAQHGIITDTHLKELSGGGFADAATYAEARLTEAYSARGHEWYRIAAAYRLGKPLFDAPEVPEIRSSATATGATPPASRPEAADPVSSGTAPDGDAPAVQPSKQATIDPTEFALGMVRFGLAARLRTELGNDFASLSPETVRTAAQSLSDAGKHEAAYRLIATQFWKRSFVPTRADAGMYWPRPWPELFADIAGRTGVDINLLYGLARSESAFNPAAVSRSGAVGLVQLMPATAAEMAGRLKMTGYDLGNPEDNLALGAGYFARLVTSNDGRVMPAIFSYNGGPTRYRRWERDHGNLPADLMLESLPYAETRQYGRNVASAALAYAALYGEGDLKAYWAWLTGDQDHP